MTTPAAVTKSIGLLAKVPGLCPVLRQEVFRTLHPQRSIYQNKITSDENKIIVFSIVCICSTDT